MALKCLILEHRVFTATSPEGVMEARMVPDRAYKEHKAERLRSPSAKWISLPLALRIIAGVLLSSPPMVGIKVLPLGRLLVAEDVRAQSENQWVTTKFGMGPLLMGPSRRALIQINRSLQDSNLSSELDMKTEAYAILALFGETTESQLSPCRRWGARARLRQAGAAGAGSFGGMWRVRLDKHNVLYKDRSVHQELGLTPHANLPARQGGFRKAR